MQKKRQIKKYLLSNLEKNTTDSCFPPRHRFSTNPLTTKSRESRIFCQGFTRPQAESWERILEKIAHYLGPMFSLIGDMLPFGAVSGNAGGFLQETKKQEQILGYTLYNNKNKYKSMQSLHHLKRVLPTFIQISTRRLDVSPLRAPPQLPRDAHQQQPPANTTGRTVLILRASHLKFNQLMCSKCDSTWSLSSCMLKVHIQCR